MVTTLLRASLDGAIFVAAVWALTRLLPRLSASTRAILWWCAATKVLVALVWVSPIAVPILPSALEDSARRAAPVAVAAAVPQAIGLAETAPSSASAPARGARVPGWSAALLSLWGAGLLVAIGTGVWRWRLACRIVRQSTAAPADVQDAARNLAGRLGIRRVPEVRVSGLVETPLVLGLMNPLIVLPAGRLPALSERQRRMAICHELAHVRRGNLWLGCAPALAERVFFFHPLVRLAAREYALCREAACDAAVLDALGAAPQEYGRLLLDLGVSPRLGGFAAAGAPWSFPHLKRRIVMLSQPSPRSVRASLVAGTVVLLAVAALAPLRLAARGSSHTVVVPVDAPAPIVGDAAGPSSKKGDDLSGASAPAREARPDDGLNYVMFLDQDRTTMSGSTGDIGRARRQRRGEERLLWFRHDGRE